MFAIMRNIRLGNVRNEMINRLALRCDVYAHQNGGENKSLRAYRHYFMSVYSGLCHPKHHS